MSTHFEASILIVEDDPQQVRLYAQALSRYRLTCVSTGTAALAALAERVPDLILLDNVLARGEIGTTFLPRLKEAAAQCRSLSSPGPWTSAANWPCCKAPIPHITCWRNRFP